MVYVIKKLVMKVTNLIDSYILKKYNKLMENYCFPSIINACVIRGECPCRCIHCPVGLTPYNKREEKFGINHMDLNTFSNIIKQIPRTRNSTLRIHGVGEPLMWKNLREALRIIKAKKIISWIFTCGIGPKYLLKEIVQSCSIVEVSINSIDRENYYRTKGVDAFDEVMSNIKFMHEIIERKKLNTRLIATRVDDYDKNYNKKFVDFWKTSGIVNDAFIRTYHDYNGMLKNKKNRGRKQKIIPCAVHWKRFNIDYDGNVVICFNELFKSPHPNPQIVLGNINETTIEEIWNSEKLRLIRIAQLTGNYNILGEFIKFLPCVKCNYCQPLETRRPTSENQIRQYLKYANNKSNKL